ncbi:MAG: calcineurin-like phosphoesterase family protein [Phycisphaerae bacterium]|jgi:hypothetical protein
MGGRLSALVGFATLVVCAGCRVPQPAVTTGLRAEDNGRHARGIVYHDRNRNGARDAGERGILGVRVSNGREVVVTDGKGRYVLPVDDDTVVFVIKPAGWMTPVDERNLPRFYYVHKPQGSPKLQFAGVAPTGPLPTSIDFALYKHDDRRRFRVLLFGDTQPYTQEEVDFLAHDIIEEVIGFEASFGVSLGDLVGNDLALFEPLTEVVKHVGIPWYNVLGNHDLNFDAPGDAHSTETFQRVFGPPYYSFEYGEVHFIVVDDVIWSGSHAGQEGKYIGGIDAEQLEFIKNDLALTPKDRLVVLMMHIPLSEMFNRQQLFDVLAGHPHTFSMSAHLHTQHHDFLGEANGWAGAHPHHHFVNVTTCGSWWSGLCDEENIPHTTMRDGAPNGYSIITFDGHDYSIRYKAARRPADHQMTIFAPEEVGLADLPETEVVANVFAGSGRSVVEMRLGDAGDWIAMERAEREDPYYQIMKAAEEARGTEEGRLPRIRKSRHIWVGKLPGTAVPGTHVIHIRTTDMFGQTYLDHRIIRVH